MHRLAIAVILAALATPAAARDVAGQITLRERLALPPDTWVRLELLAADGWRAMLEITPGASQPPYAFAFAAPDVPLALTGWIETAAGSWMTETILIAPGEDAETGFLLAESALPSAKARYLACGEALIAVATGPDGAQVQRGRNLRNLPPSPAGGGGYSDGLSPATSLSMADGGIRLTWDGEDLPACIPFPDPATTGITARGNEPGWVLTLGPDGAALSHQDGTRATSALPPARLVWDALRLLPPGLPEITLAPGPCFDSMTGMPYPLSVSLADDRTEGGCGGDPATLLAGGWRVTEINGAPLASGVEPTLDFTDGRLTGHSGCNRFTGAFMLSGEALMLGPVAGTRMACPDPQMQTESALYNAFTATDRFGIDADGALLLIGGDRTLLRAQR